MMSSDLNAAQDMKLTLEKRLTLLSNAMEGQKKMMAEEVSGKLQPVHVYGAFMPS